MLKYEFRCWKWSGPSAVLGVGSPEEKQVQLTRWSCCVLSSQIVSELSWETSLPLSTTLSKCTVKMALPGQCRQKIVPGVGHCFLGLFLADISVWELNDISFPESEERHLAHFRFCGLGKQEKPLSLFILKGRIHWLLPSSPMSGFLGYRERECTAFHCLWQSRETGYWMVTTVTTHCVFPF